jgi:hypothetical protein
VDPVPDPLLLRRSGSAGNGTRDLWICSQDSLDHRGGRPKGQDNLQQLFVASACILLGLLLDSEDGRDKFLRNVEVTKKTAIFFDVFICGSDFTFSNDKMISEK